MEGDGPERVKWVPPTMVAKDGAAMGLGALRVLPPPAGVVEVVMGVGIPPLAVFLASHYVPRAPPFLAVGPPATPGLQVHGSTSPVP
jgi:hypothetical protein